MKVVVAGATGNIGTAVLRRLRSDPAMSITGLARRLPPPGAGPPYDHVRWVSADVTEPGSLPTLAEAMRGADALVHLVWAIQPSRDESVLARVNLEGTQRLLDAARVAGVPHVVYLSSVGAYSPGPKDRQVGEEWPRDGIVSASFSRHKAAVERLLDRITGEGRHPVVTRLRPGLVFQRAAAGEIARYFLGPLAPLSALRTIRLPALPLPDAFVFQVVHADDVAEAVGLALAQRAEGAFNLAADPVVSPDLLAEILSTRRVRVSTAAVRRVAEISFRARLQPTVPGWVDLAASAPVMSTDRAREVLGWKPKHGAADAIRDLVAGLAQGTGAASPALRPRGRLWQRRQLR